ncbi:uncharacterized protein LOC132737405 [Ruditapes philippinarum]|uniref:uncharacterized protein LOC132737405 n=1 Tax=Ruditapes philippinarum TaxID=129788 RepID=UPI00295B7130|nr:uncharacterized protein LOC132737405 [Ruditapes philippinarum]XP_060580672.1 uncharacterized protein LOC132737405 [Ruditapes philippinarum]
MLANKKLIAAAAVLCDMLAPLCTFSDYLQGDVYFTLVNEKVSALVDKLHSLVHRFKRVGQGEADIGLKFSKVESFWEEIDDRTDLSRRLRGPPSVTIHQFAEEFAVPIVYSLIGEVEDAFHCSEVLQSFSVFNMKNVPDSIADVINIFGQVRLINYLN